MSILVHLAIFLTYAAIAAAVAWRGEVWLADLGLVPPNSGQAWPLAAAIFFGGGLLHEIYARLGRETYLSRQLLSLRHAYAVLLEQQTLVKQEAAALHDNDFPVPGIPTRSNAFGLGKFRLPDSKAFLRLSRYCLNRSRPPT